MWSPSVNLWLQTLDGIEIEEERHEQSSAGKRPHGQIRQSQVITTFGPGAMMDLPESLGARWAGSTTGSRWARRLPSPASRRSCACSLTSPSVHLRLRRPTRRIRPPPCTGINGLAVPGMVSSPRMCASAPTSPHVRSRRLVHRRTLQNGRFVDDNRQRQLGGARALRARLQGGAHQ